MNLSQEEKEELANFIVEKLLNYELEVKNDETHKVKFLKGFQDLWEGQHEISKAINEGDIKIMLVDEYGTPMPRPLNKVIAKLQNKKTAFTYENIKKISVVVIAISGAVTLLYYAAKIIIGIATGAGL